MIHFDCTFQNWLLYIYISFQLWISDRRMREWTHIWAPLFLAVSWRQVEREWNKQCRDQKRNFRTQCHSVYQRQDFKIDKVATLLRLHSAYKFGSLGEEKQFCSKWRVDQNFRSLKNNTFSHFVFDWTAWFIVTPVCCWSTVKNDVEPCFRSMWCDCFESWTYKASFVQENVWQTLWRR